MDITSINLGACPLQYLSVGYVGETGARPVAFDFAAWAEEYGSGVLQLLLQRPGDAEPYPVYLSIDGTTAVWTPNDTDTEKAGQGQAQLVYTVGGVVVKNAIFRVLIAPSLGAPGDPPEPYETWLERLTELAAETQQSALDAAESAEAAETSAEAAAGSAGAAAQSALDAEAAKTAAETAEQTAQQAATLARAKAAEAAEAAQIAGENADYAMHQSVAAGDSAVSAHDDAELAAQSAEDAQAAASAAQTAATAAGAAAADAAATVNEVETKGAEQITAINQAGTTQIAAVDAAGAAQVQAIEDKGEEVIDSIPSDYTELEDDVSDLKSSTAHISTPTETEADLYVCDEQGNVIAEFADGHIKTKNFDSSAISVDLVQEADKTAADLYVSDSFGNVVAEFRDGQIVTKNFNSADHAILRNEVLGLLSEVSGLLTDVADLEAATSGIVYRNFDATDGVYAACRYHQPNATSKQFCLLLAGDVHADRIRTQNMVEYLNAVDAFDAGIMLGDISGNEYTDTIAFYLDALKNVQKPFLTVLGNHDVVGAASDTELYTKFGDCFQYAQLASGEAVSGKCYYYKDFATQKIRVIVLMQYDLAGRASDTGDLCFGQDQIDWFISVLQSTPTDYGVIIAEHTNPGRQMDYNMDTAYTSSTWHLSEYAPTLMDGDPIPDIVDAWISGGTLTQTYAYTYDNPPSPLSVNVDFTARGAGEFITYIGGHWHMSVLGNAKNRPNQPDYHTDCASLWGSRQGDTPRRSDTRSEDALTALAVDRDLKTVKIFRVGAHFTKDAVDRLYFKYSYGGNT